MEITIEFIEIIDQVSISFEDTADSFGIEFSDVVENIVIEFAELGVQGERGPSGELFTGIDFNAYYILSKN